MGVFVMSLAGSYENKIACEGDELHIRCHQSLHLAIYGAVFGRTLEGSVSCPAETTYDVGKYRPNYFYKHSARPLT